MFYQMEKICPQITRIWDVSHTACYLIEGAQAAVLVDTGVGVGSLKSEIEALTAKPVTVLLTHGHVDHAMGAAEFDRVFMNLADLDVMKIHGQMAVRTQYVNGAGMLGGDPAVIRGISQADYLPVIQPERLQPLEDGAQFPLGGLTVQVLSCPGHTPGSMVMLIPELRTLILGDACNGFTYLFDPWCPTVAQYRENLLRLRDQTAGAYDRTLFNHGTGEGSPDMVDHVIQVCDDILAGKADNQPFQIPVGDPVDAVIAKEMDFQHFCRADGGDGNVIYCPARIR